MQQEYTTVIMNLNKPYFWLKIDLKGVFSYSQKLTFQSQRKKRKSVKLIEGDEGYFCDS